MKQRRIADLFARDKKRCERFSVQSGDLYLDYSKNLLNAATRKHLLALAKQASPSITLWVKIGQMQNFILIIDRTKN